MVHARVPLMPNCVSAPVISPDNPLSSETSSASSQDDFSSDWLSEGNVLMEGQSQSFKHKVDHLLTLHEKNILRRALTDYNINRSGQIGVPLHLLSMRIEF